MSACRRGRNVADGKFVHLIVMSNTGIFKGFYQILAHF